MVLKGTIKSNAVTIAALFLAAVAAGVTVFYEPVLAFIELAVIVILASVGCFRILSQFNRLKGNVTLLNQTLQVGDEANSANEFPLSLALCNAKGEIVWYNSLFDENIIQTCDFEYMQMNECMDFEQICKAEKNAFAEADIHGHYFSVWSAKLQDDLFALYFVEDTNLKNFRNAYLKTRPAVLLINIDSLENTEDTYSHIDYSAISSDIDRLISSWLGKYNCVFRRYSDGRYFVLTEYENLDKMIAARFDLLDVVRNYRYEGNDSSITLSVGIGREESFRACERSARSALDMARGRGGDQVAIKIGDNYEFFGGLSAKKDKRGKVKSRSVAAALSEIIEKSDNCIIMGHAASDFDCIGAAVGIAALCSSLNVPSNIVLNRNTTLAMQQVENCEKNGMLGAFISPEEALTKVSDNTLLVITDILRASNVDAPALLDKTKNVVLIDHHRMAVDRISNPTLLFHEPFASSACEMVTELIQYAPSKPKLSTAQAEALMAGIILDTKNFSFRVGVRTFEAAAFLRDRKTDTVRVKKMFAYSEEENLLVNRIVQSAKIHNTCAIAYTDIQNESIRKLCSQAADNMLDIKGVDASFVAYRQNDAIGISARSLGYVNVQLIMETLGGGGHQSMAGAQLRDKTPQEAMQMLADAIQQYFNTNGSINKEE